MNKKEKEILEKRVLESELECLEAEENMKSDKSKLEYLKIKGAIILLHISMVWQVAVS